MSSAALEAPVPLKRGHKCDEFDCGSPPLNEYLTRFAWSNQESGAARTYVACRGKRVVGYYSLAFGGVEHETASPRVRKGLARHPIPIMLLARLAVDVTEQGQGIGKGLLKDALRRTLQAADIGGLRAVIVHATDAQAKAFHERFGFEPSPVDELHWMLLLKDVRKIVIGSQ
ncbi:MAG: GNAT family N-acetyltransferase [Planctomycetota bacterium]